MTSCFSGASCLTPTTGATPQTFAAALQYFAAAQCLLPRETFPEAHFEDGENYDFIVIGGGSAGSVVTNRLSANPNWKVLLLEAGSDAPLESDIPGLEGSLFNTEYDWQYLTTNDGRSSQGLKDGSVGWNRAKMLGGCSCINAMIYFKGDPQVFQTWYDAGNKEWSVDNVLKCFKKAENLENEEMLSDPEISEHYGHNGPLTINTFNVTLSTYVKKVLKSWNEIGFRNVKDMNMENFMTSGTVTVTAANGIRQSTDRAYLMPAAKRSNLRILKKSLVTKILIDENLKAYGVEVLKGGKKYTFKASREVILSAGAISSPQLLMLSGIGPKDHLQEKGVTCIVDSPQVGQNLQDHSLVPVIIYGDEPKEVDHVDVFSDRINYLANRKGSLSHSDLFQDGLSLFTMDKKSTYSDLQNILSIFPKNTSSLRETFSVAFRYNDTVVDSIVELNKKYGTFFLMFNLLKPYSKGNISLHSNDPTDHPSIFTNYFQDPRDLDIAAAGLRKSTEILNTKYFKSINAFLGRMDIPACNDLELNSFDYWKCISLNMVSTIFHPVRTCQMGTDISASVVDSRLRVHGLDKLRVVDCSVLPTTVNGNLNAITIMVGERASELIIEDNA